LNAVCTHIADIDYETIIQYPGNYDDMVRQKAQVRGQVESGNAKKMEKIKQLQDFVQKFGAGTRSTQAASRKKEIERLRPDEIKRSNIQRPYIRFEFERSSGREVLTVHKLAAGYDTPLFSGLHLEVSRGDKIGIIGRNGGGKTTLVSAVLERVPRLVRSVSMTTRPRRPLERHGVDYRFVSLKTFERLRQAGEFLEWARVHEAWYGTPRGFIARALHRGLDVVLNVDVQGARQIKRRFGAQAVLIFVVPPSLKDLRTRLIKRRTETPDAIRKRLEAAKRELACSRWYDYVIVNRRLQEAVTQLEAIVTAERLRVRARAGKGGKG